MKISWKALLAIVVALVILVASWFFLKHEKEDQVRFRPTAANAQAQVVARNMRQSFSNAVATIKPAVASISAFHMPPGAKARPDKKSMRAYKQMGSGFFINHHGYLITNYHVTVHASEIKVTIFNGDHSRFYDAEVVAEYPDIDLSILKVASKGAFPCAMLGDSRTIRVGDWMLAVGSPFGLDQSVTAGIVSATRQSVFVGGAQYDNLIQTDAPINPGNSGGPLANAMGEVIGMNSAISASPKLTADIGFAIPINKIKKILDANKIHYMEKRI
ncbi:S1C family serine protease [Elusimicrobiota bacterium]